MSTGPATPGTPAPAAPIGPVVPPTAHGHGAPIDPGPMDWAPFNRLAILAAIIGWTVFAVAGVSNLGAAGEEHKHDAKSRFFVAYLTGFVFWASLPLGAMGLLMIRYLAKTSWGLLLTRPFEAATRTLPLTILLFLPLAGAVWTEEVSPYWWSHPHSVRAPEPATEMPTQDKDKGPDKRDQAVKASQVMVNRAVEYQKAIADAHHHEKADIKSGNNGFLTRNAYLFVGAILFTIWGTIIYLLNKWGAAATSNDPRVVDKYLERLSNLAGPGLIIFAITTTAAATQWVMSTEPGWSSTMFPVIYTINQFLTCFAFCLALFLMMVSRAPFKQLMRPKFQIDMGTLLLAFTLFWSYTSFSQFMLVWIGNLPEEIPFYLKRSNMHNDHGDYRSFWWYVSAALIALHFALPFLLLLFRNIKMHPVRLRIVAIYLVVICMIDVIWWIAPSAPHHNNFPAWLMDAGAILGVGGIWALFFFYNLKKRPLFPDNQAFLLPEGHAHGHH